MLTWTASDAAFTSCFGTLGYLAGSGGSPLNLKPYFEATLTTLPGGSTFGPGIGIANSSALDSQYLGQTTAGIGYYLKNGDVLISASHVATYYTLTQGATVGVAVDFVNQKVWFTKDGLTWNDDILANQNPATNTGGAPLTNQIFAPSGVYSTVYPAFGNGDASGTSMTANFGASPFAFALPAGFVPWASPAFQPWQGMFALLPSF
jgi:hypothetical protein